MTTEIQLDDLTIERLVRGLRTMLDDVDLDAQRQLQQAADTLERIREETAALVDMVPAGCRIRSCEGGGTENLFQSLALSIAKLTRAQFW